MGKLSYYQCDYFPNCIDRSRYKLHSADSRDQQYYGDPFDFFYSHLGLLGWEIEVISTM